MKTPHIVFIAGGTGYMGQQLAKALVARSHQVRILARPGSENRVPPGCEVAIGNPLFPETFASDITPCDTWIHLVGVHHPSPRKAEQFKTIDLRSIEVAIPLAIAAGIRHFIYVSVAHPAPVMKAYIDVRTRCEELLRCSGLHSTILRPWYVLGRGHRWPHLLKPVYALLETLPSTAESARRLGLVTLPQMVAALAHSVEDPTDTLRVLEVPQIRDFSDRQRS